MICNSGKEVEISGPPGHGAHHFQNATFWSRGPTGDLTEKYTSAGFINFLYYYSGMFGQETEHGEHNTKKGRNRKYLS
jgi:hypothetical protein